MDRTRHRRAALSRAHGVIVASIGSALLAAPAAVVAAPWAERASAPAAEVAHDFVLEATDGHNHRLSEYRGEPVVVTFWGSWCGPCRESLATLDAVSRQTDTPVLGISLDVTQDRAAAVTTALRISFPTLVDVQQQVARAYDVEELPLTLLLDRAGVVRARWSGAAVDGAELSRSLASLARE